MKAHAPEEKGRHIHVHTHVTTACGREVQKVADGKNPHEYDV